MENNIYTVDFFINKFSPIPEGMFITKRQSDNRGNHCAIGWCSHGRDSKLWEDRNNDNSPEAKALISLFTIAGIQSKTMPSFSHYGWNVADVNNGDHPDYKQSTPKQRILQALYDIKAKQQPEVKERIVYVTVDAKVRELQKLESPN